MTAHHEIWTTLQAHKAGIVVGEIDHVKVTVATDGEEWWPIEIEIPYREPFSEIRRRCNDLDPAWPLLEAAIDRVHIDSRLQEIREDA